MRWYILLALVSLAVLILTEESEGWWRRRRSSRRRSSYRPPPRYYRRRSISYTRRRRSVSRGCGYLYCYNGGTKYCGGWLRRVAKCRCRTWTRGKQCRTITCPRKSCKNGGTNYCKSRGVSACRCRSGFYGPICTGGCPLKTCYNGGRRYCKRGFWGRNFAKCRCTRGWKGHDCRKGCPLKTCYNGGRRYCKRGFWGRYLAKCRCTRGWKGHDCRKAHCKHIDCKNGGTKYCRLSGQPYCRCRRDFTGSRCENGCRSKTCYNGGTKYCTRGRFFWRRKKIPKCKCPIGWYRHDCRKACPSFYCKHGKVGCTNHLWIFTFSHCVCDKGWKGKHCDKPTACRLLRCYNGGTKVCKSSENASCRCRRGTRGKQCQIIDGNWSSWSTWTFCSHKCGDDGIQKRRRQCNNPEPAHGGRKCTGQSRQKRRCNRQPCPIDGKWSRWSQWAPCSRTCGGGIQKRMRKCDKPKPAHGGRYCTGQSMRARRCNPQPCPRERIYVRITFKTGRGKFPGKNPKIRIYGTKKTSKPLIVLGSFQPGKSRNETIKLKADLGTLKKIEIVNSPNIIRGWKLEEVIIDSVVGKKMKRYYACFKKGERVYSNKLTTKKLVKGPCPIIKPDIVVRVTFKTGRKSFGYNPIILINGTKGTVKLSFARTFNPGTTTTVNKTLNADLGTLKSIHVMNILVTNGTNASNNSKLKAGNSTISMSNSRGWDLEMVSVQFVGKKNEVYRACFKGTPIFNLPIKKNLTKGKISC